MITLNWDVFTDGTATSFNVYRALPGLTIPFPNSLVVNDVLTFSATSVDIQTVTFTATDIASFVTQFNAQAVGARAVANTGNTAVLIRALATTKSKFKIYPCTAATHLGITPRTIVPALEWGLLGSVTFVTNVYNYSFTDNDGTELDAYRITSVLSSVESLPSLAQFPQIGTDSLCAIEGFICDSQNHPVVGMAVKAYPRLPETYSDGHGVDSHGSVVYTDGFGRFTIYLARKAIYLLQIPDVEYNETLCVPDLPAAGFTDLIPTLAGRFAPFGDPD